MHSIDVNYYAYIIIKIITFCYYIVPSIVFYNGAIINIYD